MRSLLVFTVAKLAVIFAAIISAVALTSDAGYDVDDDYEFTAEESAVIGSLVSHIEGLEDEVGDLFDVDICKHFSCCTIENEQACSISEMTRDKSNLVYPGGDTRCIFSHSKDYSFQVIPGDSDKMVFYFQGGGACWNKMSTKLHLCRTRALPLAKWGMFDRDSDNNRFKGHTIVNVLYCSGDAHAGNATHSYTDRDGVPVQQQGLANAQSVLDWVAEQQSTGALAASFSELIISGDSAGSLGTQLWAKQVLSTLKWDRAAVIPDSYIGVFPEGSEGILIKDFGFCNSGFLSESLYEKCTAGEITLQDISLEFIAATPTVPYAFIQSKIDIIQRLFFDAVAILSGYRPKFVSPAKFYSRSNSIMEVYNSQLSNFLTYLVDGQTHIYSVRNLYYSADATGSFGRGKHTDNLKLREWVEQFPLTSGQAASSICEGKLKLDMEALDGNDTSVSGLFRKYDYCSDELFPKQFVEA